MEIKINDRYKVRSDGSLNWMPYRLSEPRGRGISFTELPFINARIAANAMRLRMSGLLDGLDGE